MPAPHLGAIILVLVTLLAIGTGAWVLLRAAVRSGTLGAQRRQAAADRRREMERWEATRRAEN
jgi:uncharacterized membrane protein YqjE